MKYTLCDNRIIFERPECLSLRNTLFCGQCFRWQETAEGCFQGTVRGSSVKITEAEQELIFEGITERELLEIWVPYFALDTDYALITEPLRRDFYISQAMDSYYGIRILRQEPWEALCSFIISQNNNIPRISGIIKRMCELFGEKTASGDYSFPDFRKIASLTKEQLSPLRAGFRADYILDAAKRLSEGEISVEKIALMPMEEARQELMKIKGVGPKVAECTLLYGFGRLEAFPVDVWVKRIMSELYPEGLPSCTRGVEGIAQQYLFHWRRSREEK